MNKTFVLLIIFTLAVLGGCQKTPAAETTPSGLKSNAVTNADIQKLIDRTLKNMIYVEGGSFMMGDSRDEMRKALGDPDQIFKYYLPTKENQPVHKVTLDSYYMGKFEVTYAEHDIFTAATGREPTRKRDIDDANDPRLREETRARYREKRAPQNPAGVSWRGAKDYCLWLGEQTGLPFDLPTEAQWEYAARSRGKMVLFATDNGKIDRGRNYPPSIDHPMAVGQFPPNSMGFYDMAGNAYEWVQDWYDPEYYSRSPEHNPLGPETGTKKVVRGGGVNNSPGGSSTVLRSGYGNLDKSYPSEGVRCVINTDKPLPAER